VDIASLSLVYALSGNSTAKQEPKANQKGLKRGRGKTVYQLVKIQYPGFRWSPTHPYPQHFPKPQPIQKALAKIPFLCYKIANYA
jgi:hypothetical protein